MIRSYRRMLAALAAVGALSVGGVFAGVAGAQSNEVVISGSSTVEPITSLDRRAVRRGEPGRDDPRRRPRHR